MRRVRQYFINAAMLAAVSVGMRMVSVSFNVYLSGKIGASGMGLLSLIMTVYGLAVTFACSGIHLAVVRLVAENSDGALGIRRILRSSVFYSAFFGITGCMVLFALSSWLGSEVLGDVRTIPSLRMIALSLPFLSLTSVFQGYFSGVRRVYKNAVCQVLEQMVKVGLCTAGLLLIAPAGLEYGCLAVVGGGSIAELFSFCTALLLYLWDRKHHFGDAAGRITAAQSRLREVIGIAFPVAVSAYARSGLLTAEHLAIPWGLRKNGTSSEKALASYGILHGMVMPVLLFPSAVLGAFSGLLIPEIAECRARADDTGIRYISGRVIQISLLFSIGVAGIFICFSYELGMTIYQSSEAAAYIKLIAPLIPVMYLDGAVDSILKGLGQQIHSMRINIVDSALSLILVVLLLPKMGIYGYVVVIFICEMLNASLSICRLLTVTELEAKVGKWVIKPLLSIILSTSATRFAFSLIPDLFPQNDISGCVMKICLSSILYVAMTLLTGSFSRDDVQWMKKIFR